MNTFKLPKGYNPKVSHKEFMSKLSPRQKEAYVLLFTGLNGKQISKEIGIRIKTLKYHLTLVYKKLGVKTRRELIGKFLENEKKK